MYDVEVIRNVLPQSYPFLLIDRISNIVENDSEESCIESIKCVSANEPFFQGHFNKKFIMPGVLILEAIAQTGAFYILKKEEYKEKLVLFTGADNVKWRRMVVPGDVLKIKVVLNKIRRSIGKAVGLCYVGNDLVCQADLSFAIK